MAPRGECADLLFVKRGVYYAFVENHCHVLRRGKATCTGFKSGPLAALSFLLAAGSEERCRWKQGRM